MLLLSLLSMAPLLPLLLLSPDTPWPPHSLGIGDLWLAETGRLCRHSPSAHSSVDLGVVLRISFAAGPISPFTNSARREKIERIRVFSFRVFATFFFLKPPQQLLARPPLCFSCGHFGPDSSAFFFSSLGRRRCRRSTCTFFFEEEACGLCSIIWSVGFPLLRQKHGSTNLQNRWKRGSCGRKAGRRRGCCGEVERTGKRDVLIVRVLIAGAEFCLGFCCVNGVLHVSPCKRIPTLTGFSGKVATCTRFSPACALFQMCCFLLLNVVSINIGVNGRLQIDICAFFNSCFFRAAPIKECF